MKTRKDMSVRFQITLWYTLLMILLSALFLVFLLAAGNARSLTSSHNRLKKAVLKSTREISVSRQELLFDEDFIFTGLEEGIYLSAYDVEGQYLHGYLPAYYNGPSALLADTLQQEYDFHTQWYIYDSCITLEGYGPIWIRGMTAPSESERLMPLLLRLSLILFPFLIFFIALGGSVIIRRALAPLTVMTQTAETIAKGRDLSQRIGPVPRNNEVYQLADTFDHMMDRLQNAFEQEKQFTSDVSHELRTPLSVILAQCEYMLSGTDSLDTGSADENTAAFLTIKKQASKMNVLISQLLMLARAESGRQILHPEYIHLGALVSMIIEEQRISAAEKNITLELFCPEELILHADETLITRLFINLISNAITYGVMNGYVRVTLQQSGDSIHGEIADNGIGISPEHLDKIWNRFYQVDPSRKHSDKNGSGLGLPMVRWILSAHHGDISVQSTPGTGTVFQLHLPQDPFIQDTLI